ncbi:type II toxin-antitoxin system HicA family toxin [Candidatus Methylomirabilis sp.]|uniref:type II toxin-antitoxin system HicA family toxin n=1 Tax=Candidatus Methylomirabilis sp. TaxID=2032687 RepID=UPI002A5FA3BE|nr:type II toxin-antitoxin system HicA family toxin [Candidatus Methylomirabilis sp.]
MIEELKSVAVRKLIRALERDGFVYRRLKGSQRIYRHPDGRRVVIHYHHGGDTLPAGTLQQLLAAANWNNATLRRLGLIK